MFALADFSSFQIARLPKIVFGNGSIEQVPHLAAEYGKRALLVLGRQSFQQTSYWVDLQKNLHAKNISWEIVNVSGEPSPQLVDEAVAAHHGQGFEWVLGIGGGSVLDAAKAIAGLLPHGNSVMDHLEGVGRGIPYQAPATPFIAVPTTAGTGSEATKNAVLSQQGENGFKKSFRHDALVPHIAVIDPQLLASCPAEQIAANGMDAFTQLLESYVSTRANPLTDALALSGISAFAESFWDVWENSDNAVAARPKLAYASLLSGINLAQTGLGSVHGLASPLGAFYPIPHGVVCGTLVAEATDINIRALHARLPDSVALDKYAQAGRLLTGQMQLERTAALEQLVKTLREWTKRLQLPTLDQYGLNESGFARIVKNSQGNSMKTNPLVLEADELQEILQRRRANAKL